MRTAHSSRSCACAASLAAGRCGGSTGLITQSALDLNAAAVIFRATPSGNLDPSGSAIGYVPRQWFGADAKGKLFLLPTP